MSNVIGGPFCGTIWDAGLTDGQEGWASIGPSRYVYRWCADVRRWVEVGLYRAIADARCNGK